MELTYVGIAVLASMIFVLSGMVGYLYWQQTMLLKNVRELASIITVSIVRPEPVQHLGSYESVEEFDKEHPAEEEKPAAEEGYSPDNDSDSDSDDESSENRLSVHDKVETVEGPPAEKTDVDDLQSHTVAQLREILMKKGIPYGKRDTKTVLIQLLKATA